MWNRNDSRITFEAFNQYREKCGLHRYNGSEIRKFIDKMINEYETLEYIDSKVINDVLSKVDFQSKYHSNFISQLRQYMRYLNIIGIPAYIPDEAYSVPTKKFNPHIFTYEELNIFFERVDNCQNESKIAFKDYVYPLYYRMMYCCGMRPQEVANLRIDDVDIQNGEIYIRKTKHYKDRHIYISDDLLKMVQKYYYEVIPHNKVYFFENKEAPLTSAKMRKVFKSTLRKAGLDPNIRPYDFRHAFISNTISEWIENGENVMVLIPYLSEYVGHYDFESTYYYLHLIPENLRENSGIKWNSFCSLYPDFEVDKNEN